MTDADLMALCIYEEAGGEIDDGKAAVCRVILNRQKALYESDGTVAGTVLKYDQFSWAWFAFVNGKYRRVADTIEEATAMAEHSLTVVPPDALAHCSMIAAQVQAGTYSGALYDQLTDDALMYVNLGISKPSWATLDKFVCKIDHHSFFRA